MSAANCELHPRCEAWGVRGLCCPTKKGTMLTCCDGMVSDAPTKEPTPATATKTAQDDDKDKGDQEKVVAQGGAALAIMLSLIGCCFCCVIFITMRKKKGKDDDEKQKAMDELMKEIKQIAIEEGAPPPTMSGTAGASVTGAKVSPEKESSPAAQGDTDKAKRDRSGITSMHSTATGLTGVGKMKHRASHMRKHKGKRKHSSTSSHAHHRHRRHTAKPGAQVSASKKRWDMLANHVKSPQERFASCALILAAAEKRRKEGGGSHSSHKHKHHHRHTLKGATDAIVGEQRLSRKRKHSHGHHHHHHHKHSLKGATDAIVGERRLSRARRHSHRSSVTPEAAFAKIDANGDGSLDRDEFAAACGEDGDAETIGKLFQLLDENSDGTVDVRELCHALKFSDEARELASTFDGLKEIVKVSTQRKKRGKSSRKSKSRSRRSTMTRKPTADGGDGLAAAGGPASVRRPRRSQANRAVKRKQTLQHIAEGDGLD